MSAATGPAGTRDQPLIAVDVMPVSFTADALRVATARRQFEPFEGRHALPGVLLCTNESLHAAAQRALATKAGIGGTNIRHLFQIGAFDGSNRDPRQHAISIVFVAVIDPKAGAAPHTSTGHDTTWWPVGSIPGLPFDHDEIVVEALAQLRTRLWRDDAVTRALTGPWFSTPDAVRLTNAVAGTPTHQSNLRRALAANPELISTLAPDTGRPGRRPLVWEWVR